MKYALILLVLVLALPGCTWQHQNKSEGHIFNPFYRPGGNPTGPPVSYTSNTPENMGAWQ